MTTTIALLVIGSIAAVSSAIYVSLHSRSVEASQVQQSVNLGIAATILERRVSGSVLNWAEDGKIASFQS